MRDALFLLIIAVGAVYALYRPWIGVMLWTWISLMNPHAEFTWRAAQLPVASVVAIVTLIGLLFTREKQNPFVGAPIWVLLAFTFWICVALPFSFYLDSSLPLWLRSMKIYLMIFVTLALIDDRRKLQWFIVIIVASIGFYGLKGGVFTLLHGGQHRVWGPAGFIHGNNELALALVMTIPLMRYIQLQAEHRIIRYGLGLLMLLSAISVLGTYSRGAFLAIIAMTLFMWSKGDRKMVPALLIATAAALMLPFMPDHWWLRMESIQNYQQDNSALGRINAWKMAWNLASANFFGGGFMIYEPAVFQLYSPEPERVHAAHSIYFQVLGEHGFVGLFLFLLLGFLTWRNAARLAAMGRGNPSLRWAADLGKMVQVGLIGFGVGGSFLSLAYFDLPYNLMAAVVLALRLVRKRMETPTTASSTTYAGAAGPPALGPS